MEKDSRILVVGHGDSIDNSLYAFFVSRGFKNVFSSVHHRLDTLNQAKVQNFFKNKRPDYVFLSSVRSGGIAVNQKCAAEFIYENLESQNNIIHSAYRSGVKKLLYIGGSCVYPKKCPQPIKEEYLLAGPLESTSEPYSIAKIAGVKLCQTYKEKYGFNAIVAVPATIYGPGSDVDIETAHVIGALIGKFQKAKAARSKEVVVWGSGKPRREFLFVDDFVAASLLLMDRYNEKDMINVGCGYDISVRKLAEMIKEISRFDGKIVFDRARPDGTMKKLMDNRRLTALGWSAQVRLKEGIKQTFEWFCKKRKDGVRR